MTDDSFAVGRTIRSLDLITKKVVTIALRRNGIESELPDEATVLQAQDTLIIRGKPWRVEQVERFMQEGS